MSYSAVVDGASRLHVQRHPIRRQPAGHDRAVVEDVAARLRVRFPLSRSLVCRLRAAGEVHRHPGEPAGADREPSSRTRRRRFRTIGGIARVYVVPNISITGELVGIKIPESISESYRAHYFDFDLYGTVNFNNYVGAQIGYRSLDVGYSFEKDQGDFKMKGLYFGGVVARTEELRVLTAKVAVVDDFRLRRGRPHRVTRARASRGACRLRAASRPSCCRRTALSCGPAFRSLKKLLPGTDRHADLLHQIPRELDIGVEAEVRDVGHHVVGALRLLELEAVALEDVAHHLRAAGRSRPPSRCSSSPASTSAATPASCSGAGAPTVRKSCILRIGPGQIGRRNRPAHPPSRDAERLRQAVDGDGAIGHAVDRRDRHVLVAVVDDVLVDLVGDRQHVPLLAEPGDELQLVPGEDLPGRVVRRIDDDGARVVVERRRELLLRRTSSRARAAARSAARRRR